MIRLIDVIDIRTGNHHSVAVVSEKNARFFVPANQPEELAPVTVEPAEPAAEEEPAESEAETPVESIGSEESAESND